MAGSTREGPYVAREADAKGRPYVDGPGNGLGYDAGTLWPGMRLSTFEDAQAAAKIANEAYHQGQLNLKLKFRRLLGL